MRVCAYVMRIDSGLAPNPFHGICTLALCTPNHMRADLGQDDWILGLAGSDLRAKLGDTSEWRMIYAMHVDERLGLDDYYNRPEFNAKIPNKVGTPMQQCGDNFYRRVDGRITHTGESNDHLDELGDIRGDRVFVGREYWYFGRHAPQLPSDSWARRLRASFARSPRGLRYVYGGRGIHWSRDDFSQFLRWLDHQSVRRDPQPADFHRWPAQPAQRTNANGCASDCRQVRPATGASNTGCT